MSTEETLTRRPAPLGQCCHPACLVCGVRNRDGLGLRFEQEPDGSVTGRFARDADYQGYPDRLHGGVVSMLLDAAMMQCLFARRIQAYTARLNVRFRHPVRVGAQATIKARLADRHPPLYVLQDELLQNGKACALAEARFFGEETTEQQGKSP